MGNMSLSISGEGLLVDKKMTDTPVAPYSERVAQLLAHRACHAAEHNPAEGRIHGYCMVCGIPWPCAYAGTPVSDSGQNNAAPQDRTIESYDPEIGGWKVTGRETAPSARCVSVPMEPTPAMQQAGVACLRNPYWKNVDYGHVCEIYRIMLAAAPVAADITQMIHDAGGNMEKVHERLAADTNSADTKRLDYLAKTLHIDGTGDAPIYALFIPGTEGVESKSDLRGLLDESMRDAERDGK